MADTTTPKLGFIKPEIGASNNTWGTKVNGNFDILDLKGVFNSGIQWRVVMGDANPASSAGPWQLVRINNSTLDVDVPISVNRQTGIVTTNSLNVTGTITTTGGLTFGGAVAVTGAISASGNIGGADITANRGPTDGVYFFGTNNASYIYYTGGIFQFTSPISIPGASAFANISISGNVSVGTDLAVIRNAAITGTLTVTGATTHIGAVTNSGTLNVVGASTLESAIIQGSGGLNVTYDIAVGRTLFSNGTAVFAGKATFNAGVTVPYTGTPAVPVAGQLAIFVDANGNPCITKPDGSVVYLGVPPGTICWTGGATADAGWMLCQGQSLSRAQYPALFARFGGQYGAADGASFSLPDIRSRTIAGAGVGAASIANVINPTLGATGGLDHHFLAVGQIPAHTHAYSGSGTTGVDSPDHSHVYNQASAGFQKPTGTGTQPFEAQTATNTGGASARHAHAFSWGGTTDGGQAGIANPGWHPNVQPTICLNAQVKLG